MRLILAEVSARPSRFLALTLLVLAGYAALIFAVTAANIGRLPNDVHVFAVREGLVDAFTLSMSLSDRYHLLAEQPLVEFGYRYPAGGAVVEGTMEGVYTLTLHVATNLTLMSALIAIYLMLFARILRARRLGRAAGGGLVGLGGGPVGVLSAGAASMACCGGSGASIVFSVLGVAAGVGRVLVEYDQLFGIIGLALIIVSVWATARVAAASSACAKG